MNVIKIHNFIFSSGSGTVISYGSGSTKVPKDADKRIRIRIHNTGYTVFLGRCSYTSQNSVTLRRRQ